MRSNSNVIKDSAKLLITDRCNRLKEDIIEASECYKAWRKCGLIDTRQGAQDGDSDLPEWNSI